MIVREMACGSSPAFVLWLWSGKNGSIGGKTFTMRGGGC